LELASHQLLVKLKISRLEILLHSNFTMMDLMNAIKEK